jgi:hypothetical protein
VHVVHGRERGCLLAKGMTMSKKPFPSLPPGVEPKTRDYPLPGARLRWAKTYDFVFYFEDLEPGESRFFPKASSRNAKRYCSSTLSEYSKKTGRKFTTRSEHGGLRVWRVS